MEVSLIEGPVSIRVLTYRQRNYYLFSDRHNSKSGGCYEECDDFNKKRRGKCITLPLFIHDFLKKSNINKKLVDFYLESPFVLKDSEPSIVADTTDLDYIDTFQVVMQQSLMRNKSKSEYMPYSHVHYVDIRDVYIDKYEDNGLRRSSSANPLSSSWIVKSINNVIYDIKDINQLVNVIDVSISLLDFILKNAKLIFESFVGDFNPPKCNLNNRGCINYNKRLELMNRVTSIMNGTKVHRVAKQLLKLNEEDRNSILSWGREKFNSELANSFELLKEWKNKILSLLTIDNWDDIILEYEKIKSMPIMITVALGSIIMDIYVLARSMFHDGSDNLIIFGGSAHIDNYLSFFTKNKCNIISVIEPEEGTERCVKLK